MGLTIGTAGWSIPWAASARFPSEGTALERYARVFDGVEVNSSFHRPHRTGTWARWAQSVPTHFRFAVKIPKTITHQAELRATEPLIGQFALEVAGLGAKLAVLLVQLPPKLEFDGPLTSSFFSLLRQSIDAQIACEPRHPSWFEGEASSTLKALRVARVAADPALGETAAVPGGWEGLAYWRLHGSPAMYRSPYSSEAINAYAHKLKRAKREGIDAWCMFDNTAASAATGNALSLMENC
ncbi:MAG: DUF72 domain-containing protein [Pseudomonas sp.]|nr:MAG: DUF72 domain-containing protein [Pseudomonas sp.]